MRNTGDHAGEQRLVGCDLPLASGDGPKPQRIEQELGTRSHGEDVTNDAADARRRALERLDRAGMIMAFDLERDRPPIADIDHSGVFFAGSHQDVRPGGGKFLVEILSSILFTGINLFVGVCLGCFPANNCRFSNASPMIFPKCPCGLNDAMTRN